MLAALAEHFRRAGDAGRSPGRPVRLGDAGRAHRHDRPARAARCESERRVRARARGAYMDGRGGSSSMRLNFAGVPDEDIREGVRRIGKVVPSSRPVRHAHRLLGRRRRAGRAGAPRRARPGSSPTSSSCRRRDATGPARQRGPRPRHAGSPCSRAAARWSETCRCARARTPRRRSSASGTRSSAIDVDRSWSAGCATRGRTRRSSRCTAATARTAPSRRCSRRSASPTPARARRRACAAPTRSLAKHLHARRRHPDARLLRLCARPSIKQLGAAEALRAIEERARLPAGRQARRPGLGAGGQVRARRRGAARRAGRAPSPTTARCCSSATSRAATWRSRCSTAERPRAAGRRGGAARGGLLRLRGALRDRHDRRSSAPPSCPSVTTARAQELARRRLRAARLQRRRARRPDARRGAASCGCSRST